MPAKRKGLSAAEQLEKKLHKMRTELYAIDSLADVELQNPDMSETKRNPVLGIKLLLDAAVLAGKIIVNKAEEDDKPERSPSSFIDKAISSIETQLIRDPRFIQKNQETMFPLLMAIGKAMPDVYASYTTWLILGNLSVAVLDDHKRAAQRLIYLDHFRKELEPALFKAIFEARDAQNAPKRKMMEALWRSCIMRIHEMNPNPDHETGKRGIIYTRLKEYEGKPEVKEQREMLIEMVGALEERNREIRQMREDRLRLSGDAAAIAEFDRIKAELTGQDYKTIIESKAEVASITAGTAPSRSLDTAQMQKWLKKFKPEGPAN